MIRWLRDLFTPKGAGVRYSDVLFYDPMLYIHSGPACDWYCTCDSPLGLGKVLHSREASYCPYCGQTAPWLIPRTR